jgi:DNA-binding CsgD family transcriptional regulator
MEHEMAARTSLELSVQMLPLPLILVDWNLRLTYLNSAARKSVMVWQHGKEGARSLKPQNKLPLDLRQACLELQSAWNQAVRDDDMAQLRRSSVLSHQDDPSFQSTVLLVEPAKGRSLQPSFVIQFTPSSHSSEVDEQSLAKLSKLTAAESEVARLVAAGGRNEEVARELGIGVSTVRSHLRRIFEKLNITSRGKLAPLFRTI